jgi:hypothetical protein
MIDLRLHIYSLVAVFLALALGIVIGAAFIAPGSSSLKNSARGLAEVAKLEQRFNVLRTEIAQKQEATAATQARLDRTEQVCKALLPGAVAGRLTNRNVAIIQTSGSDDSVAAVRTALGQAGARVTTFVRIQESLTPDNQDLAQLAQPFGKAAGTPAADLFSAALASMANCVVWAKDADKVAALEKADFASVSGPLNHWNRLVVIVGGAGSDEQNMSQTVDAPLIDLLQKKGAQIVGCEGFEAKVSYIGAYAGKGISTVDNIDQAAGQLGLIYALTGEHGSFGTKKTADRLIPRTLENVGR